MVKVQTKWIASLSDGDTFVEGLPPWFKTTEGLSPWHQLQGYLKEKNLHLTGMRIQVQKDDEAIQTYNLPSMKIDSSGKHEKFNHLYPMRPTGYNYCRRVAGRLPGAGEVEKQIIITAKYEDFDMSIVVCEDTGNESWAIVHKHKKK